MKKQSQTFVHRGLIRGGTKLRRREGRVLDDIDEQRSPTSSTTWLPFPLLAVVFLFEMTREEIWPCIGVSTNTTCGINFVIICPCRPVPVALPYMSFYLLAVLEFKRTVIRRTFCMLYSVLPG